ncbi:mCG147654 [Mus musculus]|nr:mCG147654 [Mus musculus]
MCRGQRTTCKSQFSSSTIMHGVELRQAWLLGLYWLSHLSCPHAFVFVFILFLETGFLCVALTVLELNQ